MEIKLSKNYQDIKIFEELEMEIKEGLIHVIIGPSGCGKTTLLKCIAGLISYEGTINPQPSSIGYVFQEPRLFPYLTIVKNLLIIDNDKKKVEKLLKEFKVWELRHKYPVELSGGERQRISIIRAFLGNHQLVLMDEPFKSLDYYLKINLIHMIDKMQKMMNNTMVIVTHDLDLALFLGNRIHVLSHKVTRLKECIHNPFTHQELNEESVKLRNHLKKLML